MKILVTGHHGYIGSVMVPMLQAAGHEVHGLDSYLFAGCTFGTDDPEMVGSKTDVRDARVRDFVGFHAVVHLAALSNDPLSNLNSDSTYDINHRASVHLARLAKEAGVPRFLFSSSCSLYGVAGEGMVTETAAFNPITPYGQSKVYVERDVSKLADDTFCPTFLRNATAFGVSPRLRCDLVVNSLVGYAYTTGDVLISSDGTPWRPLVHIRDISSAFLAVLHAPKSLVWNQAFNVGRTEECYQIRDVAKMVEDVVPGSRVRYAEGGGPDPRSYRVDCSKLATTLPEFKPEWTVRRGIEELYLAYKAHGLTLAEFEGSRYLRIKHIKQLQGEGRLDSTLRWQDPVKTNG